MFECNTEINGRILPLETRDKVAEEIINTIKKELPEKFQTVGIINNILSEAQSIIDGKIVNL